MYIDIFIAIFPVKLKLLKNKSIYLNIYLYIFLNNR